MAPISITSHLQFGKVLGYILMDEEQILFVSFHYLMVNAAKCISDDFYRKLSASLRIKLLYTRGINANLIAMNHFKTFVLHYQRKLPL
jgi:hypothetical protein